MRLHGKVLVLGGGYRGGFCEKLPEASPMSDKASASQLQDGPTAGQGQAKQRQWQSLCDNINLRKRRKKNGEVRQELEKGVRRCARNNSADTKVSEAGVGRRCSRHRSRQPSLAARVEDHSEAGCAPAVRGGPRWSRSPPVACGRNPMPEQGDA